MITRIGLVIIQQIIKDIVNNVTSWHKSMMTSWNGNIFRVTGHLCGEFTGPRWIPHTKGQWRGALMFSMICVWISGCINNREATALLHDDVIKWKHFPRYWPFVRINGWVNNHEAGDLRCPRTHYDVIVMQWESICSGRGLTVFLASLLSPWINRGHRYVTASILSVVCHPCHWLPLN